MRKILAVVAFMIVFSGLLFSQNSAEAATPGKAPTPIGNEILKISSIEPDQESAVFFNLAQKIYDERGPVAPERSYQGKWILQNDTESAWVIEDPMQLYSYVYKKGLTEENRDRIYKYAFVYEIEFEDTGVSYSKQSVYDLAGQNPEYDADGAIYGSVDFGVASYVIQPGESFTIDWTLHFDEGTEEDLGDLTKLIQYRLMFAFPLTETIEITGNKVWENAPSSKPDIDIQLMRNDLAYGNPITLKEGEVSYTWYQLPKKDIDGKDYVYSIEEITSLAEFTASYSEDRLTVTNTFTGETPELFSVTYIDGVEGEEVFADQTYHAEKGSALPVFKGTPTREGYTFTGWGPALAATITGDATYAAQWKLDPVDEPMNSNTVEEKVEPKPLPKVANDTKALAKTGDTPTPALVVATSEPKPLPQVVNNDTKALVKTGDTSVPAPLIGAAFVAFVIAGATAYRMKRHAARTRRA